MTSKRTATVADSTPYHFLTIENDQLRDYTGGGASDAYTVIATEADLRAESVAIRPTRRTLARSASRSTVTTRLKAAGRTCR